MANRNEYIAQLVEAEWLKAKRTPQGPDLAKIVTRIAAENGLLPVDVMRIIRDHDLTQGAG